MYPRERVLLGELHLLRRRLDVMLGEFAGVTGENLRLAAVLGCPLHDLDEARDAWLVAP